MTKANLPNVFSNGTTADAGQVNADFNAVVAAENDITVDQLDAELYTTTGAANKLVMTDANGNIKANGNYALQSVSGGYKVQSGSVTVTASANSVGNQPVTFPTAFSSSNNLVFVTPLTGDPSSYSASASSITSTGFTAYFSNKSASSQSVTVMWVAIGS